MYIQSKFSQNTIERIFADFQINSGEEVLYAIWLSGGRKGFVFTDRRFYWNIKTSIVRNSEVTDVKLPSNIMEKNVNGLSVKIISKEKEKTSPTSKYLYFALISHIGLIRYDAARLSYDEALKPKKIFTQYINESTLPEPRHKSFADKVWANKENAVDFLWCLKNGSLFKRQHKYIATRQDIEARNEKITDYDESENSSEVYEEGEYEAGQEERAERYESSGYSEGQGYSSEQSYSSEQGYSSESAREEAVQEGYQERDDSSSGRNEVEEESASGEAYKTAKRLFLIPGMNLRNTMMRKKFQLGLEGSMCAKVLFLPAIRMKMKMVKTRILVRLLPQRKSLHARATWFKEGLRLCLSAKRGLSVMQKSLRRLNVMHNQQKKMILTQKIPGLRRMKQFSMMLSSTFTSTFWMCLLPLFMLQPRFLP